MVYNNMGMDRQLRKPVFEMNESSISLTRLEIVLGDLS